MTSVPMTPYTGGKENSGVGLFFRHVKGTEGGEGVIAQVLVSVNDRDEIESFETFIEDLKEVTSGEFKDIEMSWDFSLKTNATEVNEATRAVGALLSVDISRRSTGKSMVRFSSVVPVLIVLGWLKEIVAEDIRVLNVTFVDNSNVVNDAEHYNERYLTALSKGQGGLVWDLEDEDIKTCKEDIEFLEGLRITDTYYPDSRYEARPLYLTTEPLKSEGEVNGTA